MESETGGCKPSRDLVTEQKASQVRGKESLKVKKSSLAWLIPKIQQEREKK